MATIRNRPHSLRRRLALCLALIHGLTAPLPVLADVVPAGGKTNVYQAPNGVPVVNIETANAAGVSHNRYLQFDVDSRGLVLNNGNSAQMTRESKLASQVMANLNLQAEAAVILNEVVAANRSSLGGYLEVLGGSADVVIANPWGITCSGCGFINTPRVTLTTGTPGLGADGRLSGLDVNRGDVLVNGAGLDGKAVDVLDIVARSVKLDGQVNGKELSLVAGTNRYVYADRSATAIAGDGDRPAFAIDSSLLGGMYADRIRLVSTEAGVGVRMLGDAAASGDDMHLDAAGQVAIHSRLSAERDLNIASTDAGAEAIRLSGASLAAKRDLALAASTGGITLESGTGNNLYAGNDLRAAGHSGLALNDARLAAARDIGLDSAAGSIGVAGGAEQRIQSTGGNIAVTAQGDLTNAGYIAADAGAVTATLGGSLSNTGTLFAGTDLAVAAGRLDTSGTLQAAGLLSVRGNGSPVDVGITATGKVLAGRLDMNAGTVVMADGATLSSTGNLALTADSLSLGGSGARILAATGGGNGSITVANAFDNPGLIYSGGNLTLQAPRVNNLASGGIAARDVLTVNAAAGDLYNAGALYGGNRVNLAAAGTFANVGYVDRAQGTVDSGGDLSITAAIVHNQSTINAARDLSISAPVFKNEVAGGDTRAWVTRSAFVPSSWTDSWHSSPDDYEREYHRNTWTDYQVYTVGKPAFKPQIIGGASVTIQGFHTGSNIGGVISGATLNFTGDGAGASFVNDNLALIATDHAETYDYTTHYIAFGPAKYDDHVLGNYHLDLVGTRTIDSLGAVGLYATTLNASGFGLSQNGAPFPAAPNAPAPQSAPGGVAVQLPSNPNGYFVASRDPNARYLVETNPVFAVGQNFVGSHYLEQRYGFNPDTAQRHLGDANYEAWLIRQQLVAQVGRNVLYGYANEADQMRKLFDNAHAQGGALGMTYGVAPSEAQLANLTQDMVWMVSQVVNGQTVLAPVVYLARSTRESIEGGAAIAGSEVNLNVASLGNVGGTIAGRKSLTVTSEGDITNTSGSIKGGNVSLTSTGGNVVNETLEVGDRSRSTVLGKTAGIQATGNLAISAAKDVVVKGADVNAAGDASITAGGNVVVDTVEKVSTATSFKSEATQAGGMTLVSGSEVTETTTARNVGSNVTTGGNLKIKSGKDVTIAGSRLKSAGDLDVEAKGKFDILARQDRVTSHTEGHRQGIGVGGGLFGTESVTKDEFEGKNFASEVSAGKNARIKTGGVLTIEGSDLAVAGDADIQVKDLQLLAGKDEKRSHTETKTLTLLPSATSQTGTNSGARAEAGASGREASASASAEAGAKADAQMKLFTARTENTDTLDLTSRVSTLKTGGKLKIRAENDITLQGAKVESGGDLDVEARNINELATQDVHRSTTTAREVSFSLSTANEAKAEAGAKAEASGKKLSLSAEASAKASATSDNVIGVAIKDEKNSQLDITNRSTVLKSGGNLRIKARETLTRQASDISAKGNIDEWSKNTRNLAADDVHVTTSESKTTTVGLYVKGEVSAEAEAHAKANLTSASVGASAEAKAGAGYGLHVGHEEERSIEGSTTARVTSIKAGGNLTRHAEDRIEDVGTILEAGGDFVQSARVIDTQAARNTSFKASESDKHTVRIGQFGEASAGASAQAGIGTTGAQAGANVNAKAIAGFEAGYKNEMTRQAEARSEAVVGQIRAGGRIVSTSSGRTSLEGTQLVAGGDVEMSGSSIDYREARNTFSSTSESRNIDANLKVGGGVGASAGTEGGAKVGPQLEGSLSFGYGSEAEKAAASQAVVGGIRSGGKVKMTAKEGDLRLQGTAVDAAGDVALDAKGNVVMDAARDESSYSKQGVDVGFSAKVEVGGAETSGEGSLEVGYKNNNKRASQGRAGTIKSGGNLSIAAGKDARFEGTQLEAKGDAAVNAAGDIVFTATRKVEEGSNLDLNIGLSGGGSKEKGKTGSGQGELDVGFGFGTSNKLESTAAGIKSGGRTQVTAGRNVSMEGDVVALDKVKAGGTVERKGLARVDQTFETGFSFTVGVEKKGGEDEAKEPARRTPQAEEPARVRQGDDPAPKRRADADDPTKPAAKPAADADEPDKRIRKDGEKAPDATGDTAKPAAKKADAAGAGPSPAKKPLTQEEAKAKGWRGEDGKWLWPPNDGFRGEPRQETLQVGMTIDRFGKDKGSFFAPAGTPLGQRAMAPDTVGKELTLTKFEVLKPLPVAAGEIEPWFDQPGGGTQFKSNVSAEELVKQGYLKKIEVHQNVKTDELVKSGVIKPENP